MAEIYKIHGCCSSPNSLVLTASDYENYRKKNPYLSSKLLTLFIERPVLFLGYSLSDPHISEILQEIILCSPESNNDFLRNKLIFVDWDPQAKSPEISNSIIHHKIPVKYIQTSSYREIFEVLSETRKRLPAHLFRMIKDELYELVLTDDPKGKLYVRDADRVENEIDSTEFVVGYGAISMVKKSEYMADKGLIGLERLDLIREVIFENNKYDWRHVVNNVLPKLCKGNARIPIFYFLNKAELLTSDGELIDGHNLPNKVLNKFKVEYSSFQTKSKGERRVKNIAESESGIDSIYSKYDFSLFLRAVPYIDKCIFNNGLDSLLNILKKHIDETLKTNLSSNMCKLVCLYDFVKNSNRF